MKSNSTKSSDISYGGKSLKILPHQWCLSSELNEMEVAILPLVTWECLRERLSSCPGEYPRLQSSMLIIYARLCTMMPTFSSTSVKQLLTLNNNLKISGEKSLGIT